MSQLTFSISLPSISKEQRERMISNAKKIILYLVFPYLVYLVLAMNDPTPLEPFQPAWADAAFSLILNTVLLAIPIEWVWKKLDKRPFDKWPASYATCHMLCFINGIAGFVLDVTWVFGIFVVGLLFASLTLKALYQEEA